MRFDRFKEIIKNNRKYDDEAKTTVNEFYDKINCNCGDIPKLMREIGTKLGVTVIELPMKDSDFGAVFLDTTYSKYLLLNSNQPRSRMYFSFCHDIYHVLKNNNPSNYINEKREVYFNSEYTKDPIECKASLFAANLMMPETEFRKMYELYKENEESVCLENTVLKLMNYFNSPFAAVLLRLFELQILDDLREVKEFVEITDDDLKAKLNKLWINDEIITPTLNDEMDYVFDKLQKEAFKLIEEGLLSEHSYHKIVKRLQYFYTEIRLNG